ncbi:MAG: hypothetical protein AAF610_01420 [Pseudomonadota bacterium]
MPTARQSAASRFKRLIDETRRLTPSDQVGEGLPADRELLARWQVDRLSVTYADYHKTKRYRAALDFFLTDIYGPTDFSQRDSDIERVYPLMVKVLSVDAIESLAQALELNALSMALDRDLAGALTDNLGLDPAGGLDALTPEMYAKAYRICDNYEERQRQIELAVEAASTLEAAVQKKMIYLTVKVARAPAKAAGFGELQSFLERGLAAFKKMKGSYRFLDALAERERHVLDALFDDAPVESWYGDVLHEILPP